MTVPCCLLGEGAEFPVAVEAIFLFPLEDLVAWVAASCELAWVEGHIILLSYLRVTAIC